MSNLLKGLTAFAVGGMLCLSAAQAQTVANRVFGQPEKIYRAISAAEASAILAQDLDVSTELAAGEPGSSAALVAETADGGSFIVGFLDCEDIGETADCGAMVIFTAAASAGATFGDLNDFNLSAKLARAVYDANNQLIIFGAYIVVDGGAARENLVNNLLVYFDDLNGFFEAQPISAKSVSLGSKIDSGAIDKGHGETGPGGDENAGPAQFMLPLRKASRAKPTSEIENLDKLGGSWTARLTAAAIANTWSVRFPRERADKAQ